MIVQKQFIACLLGLSVAIGLTVQATENQPSSTELSPSTSTEIPLESQAETPLEAEGDGSTAPALSEVQLEHRQRESSLVTRELEDNHQLELQTESSSSSMPIYRLYHPITAEHLYTSDENEKNMLYNQGWGYEGIGWYAPNVGAPVYRLYNPGLQHHLYTTDTNEVHVLTSLHGWQADNNGNPFFYSAGSIPIYRLYNPALKGIHHWTTDANEYHVLPGHGWHQEGSQIRAVRLGEPTAYTMYAVNEAIGVHILTSGDYQIHPEVRQQLISAIQGFSKENYKIGFMMMDIHSQKTIEYNADAHFYAASTIKGPFVASLVARHPELFHQERYAMLSILNYSSNEEYWRLIRTYGMSGLETWAREAGVRTSITNAYYPYYSTRELLRLWYRNYLYFTDDPVGQQVGLWFENPNQSPIKASLGHQYRVRSKAGWIGDFEYQSANDAGIVYARTGPYIIAIMTDANARLPMLNSTVVALNNMVDALHDIQREMARKE